MVGAGPGPRARLGAGRGTQGPLIIDLDATLIQAHSDKQGAAGIYKQGFGFHPLGAWLDRGDGTGEALSGVLRPGNAAANTAQDHRDVLAMALLGLPKPARGQPILVRADSAGATHAFIDDLVGRKLQFSVGFDCDQRVQQAILDLPEHAFTPALDPDGRPRRGAWVAELATLDLASAGWPRADPAICRRERPHPRRPPQDGLHRPRRAPLPGVCHQPARPRPCRPGGPPPCRLEAPHLPWRPATPTPTSRTVSAPPRPRACGTYPFEFGANDAWLTLVMIAQTLVCWAQALLLDDPDLKVAEPKTLRFRLWHTAGRIVRHARQVIVRIDRTWPWAADLVAALPGCEACPPTAEQACHRPPGLLLLLVGLRRARLATTSASSTLAMPYSLQPITPSLADLSMCWSQSLGPSSPEPYQASHGLTAQQASVKYRG